MIEKFRIIDRDTLEPQQMIFYNESSRDIAWYMFDNTGIYLVERCDDDTTFFTDVTNEVYLEEKIGDKWERIDYMETLQ